MQLLLSELKKIISPPDINLSHLTKDIKQNIINYSNQLSIDATLSERVHFILTGIAFKKCDNISCENITKWNRKKRQYDSFCCIKCSNSDQQKINLTKQTNLSRYGTVSPIGNAEIRDKITKTNISRYGTKYPVQNSEIRDKIISTNIKKYGANSGACTNIIQEKQIATNIKKYGVKWTSQNEEVKNKQCNTLMSNYGVTVPIFNDDIKRKILDTHNKNYNGLHYMQTFMGKDSLDKLNNYEFLYTEHIINKKTLTQISIDLNCGDSVVGTYLRKAGIQIQYNSGSTEETHVINYLMQYDIQFLIHCRTIIYPYELDIYIPSHNLAIEYCGLYWHSELYVNADYHRMKYIKCKEKGIRLITIFSDEWLYNEELIKQKLLHILNKSSNIKIYARKTHIKFVTIRDKMQFFNNNHIQGDGLSSINLGLYYNDELIACMGFSKETNGKFNLTRYATSKIVVGGFSKLLKYFESQYNPTKITTFADLRWSNGDLYYNNGFSMDKELAPDYSYLSYNGRSSRMHKFNFRHKQLSKKLKNYDPKLSEHQNCLNHGIYRIYDCGKLRFVKNY